MVNYDRTDRVVSARTGPITELDIVEAINDSIATAQIQGNHRNAEALDAARKRMELYPEMKAVAGLAGKLDIDQTQENAEQFVVALQAFRDRLAEIVARDKALGASA